MVCWIQQKDIQFSTRQVTSFWKRSVCLFKYLFIITIIIIIICDIKYSDVHGPNAIYGYVF